MKIYMCSSWRNRYYQGSVNVLREAGHEVWDWRNPPTGGIGFRWNDAGLRNYNHGDKVDMNSWRDALQHEKAQAGFASDLAGMNWCDMGLILYPCGRSAHMEAGWLAGRGKTVHMIVVEETEPDLMVKLFNGRMYQDVVHFLSSIEAAQ